MINNENNIVMINSENNIVMINSENNIDMINRDYIQVYNELYNIIINDIMHFLDRDHP